MVIEKQTTPPVIDVPQKKQYEVCLELQELLFPFSHRDENSIFYIRPDMCIRRRDFEVILGEDGLQFSRWFQGTSKVSTESLSPRLIDEIVFRPTEADLIKELSGTLNQLTETLTAGWFAYTNVIQDDELMSPIKGNGATPWFAMADAWIQVQKWKNSHSETLLDNLATQTG